VEQSGFEFSAPFLVCQTTADCSVPCLRVSAQIAAFTYQSDRISLGRKPSPRYIGLLIEGAIQHRLPPQYLHHLQSFDLATDGRLPEPQ